MIHLRHKIKEWLAFALSSRARALDQFGSVSCKVYLHIRSLFYFFFDFLSALFFTSFNNNLEIRLTVPWACVSTRKKKHIKGLSTKIKHQRFWKMKIKTFVKINTPTNKHTHRREESRQTKCRKVSSLQMDVVWVVSVGSEFTTYYCYYYQIQNRIEWAMGRVIYARRGGGIIIIMHFHSELESFVVNVSVCVCAREFLWKKIQK